MIAGAIRCPRRVLLVARVRAERHQARADLKQLDFTGQIKIAGGVVITRDLDGRAALKSEIGNDRSGVAAASYASAALYTVTSTLAAELGLGPILINSVCPGLTATWPGAETHGCP